MVRRNHCARHHRELYKKKYGKTLTRAIAENAGFDSVNKYRNAHHPYKKHRKEYCENVDGRLGFKCTTTIVDYAYQLEVDHIDENHDNNDIKNLQTLCACCHRLKTKYRREDNQEALNLMLEFISKEK